jgi:filamentous hemagglutinin family protein
MSPYEQKAEGPGAARPVWVWGGSAVARRALLAAAAFLSTQAHAQITPSGATATNVTTAGSGKQTVSIAPSLPGGLSYNSYNSFSVGKPGADIDNRTVGARSIINEVVTTNRSVIGGPVTILGSQAHFILANPNGITVDGGSFTNAGGVVLGAGTISLQTRTPAPYLTQTNAVLNTGPGDIFIASGGLGGTMASLQMYAGKIKVDGQVTVTAPVSTHAPGDIQLLAGKSSIEFDSAVLPIAALGNWAAVTQKGTGSTEVLVDVTSNGGLSASRVIIGVTEKGAGVSYAGTGLASAAQFQINGSGQVTFTGAQITAATDIKTVGSAITILNAPAQQTKMIAVGGALTLVATNGDLTNIGGLLQGETRNVSDTDSKGAVTLTASGNINFTTQNPNQLAVAFANSDDLSVNAGGSITNTAGRLLSNKDTSINAGGAFVNGITLVDVPANSGQTITTTETHGGHWWQLGRRKHITRTGVNYGTLAVPGQLAYVVGAKVTIKAASVTNRGGEINANNGELTIITPGQFNNIGVVAGSAQLVDTCQFYCTGDGQSTIAVYGGHLNASGKINVTAAQGITDLNGQWVGIGGVTVAAPSMSVTATPLMSVARRRSGLKQLLWGKQAWSATQDTGGVITSGGTIDLETASAVLLAGGSITGKSVVTSAGITVVRTPQSVSPVKGHTIGILTNHP